MTNDPRQEAIGRMLDELMRHEPGQVPYEERLAQLEELGPTAVPVALERLARVKEGEAWFSVLAVLARSGVRDERIFTALLEALEQEPISGAMNLSRYGDARAIEPLKRALEACPRREEGEEDVFVDQALLELKEAIQRLGGSLDEAQEEKVRQAAVTGRTFSAVFSDMRSRPCWCGSGERYERCHFARPPREDDGL